MLSYKQLKQTRYPKILFNTVRRSQIMVPFIRTNQCRLTGVKILFRQQYFKIGNTREQLFHVCRSFSSDENMETIDTYVTHIRQVAALLGYGEPQILEVFKNTLLQSYIGYYSP